MYLQGPKAEARSTCAIPPVAALAQPADEGPAHLVLKISLQAPLIRRRRNVAMSALCILRPTRGCFLCLVSTDRCRIRHDLKPRLVYPSTTSRGTSRKRSSQHSQHPHLPPRPGQQRGNDVLCHTNTARQATCRIHAYAASGIASVKIIRPYQAAAAGPLTACNYSIMTSDPSPPNACSGSTDKAVCM